MNPEQITPDVAWLSLTKACDFYDVSRRTVYNWIAAGKIVTRRTPGDCLRIAVNRAEWALTEDERQKVKVPA